MEENRTAPGPKRRSGILNTAASGLIALLSAAMAVLVLLGLVRWIGAPARKAKVDTTNVALAERYDMYMTNQVSDALDGVLSVEKVYWINPDELVAPEPNPECYGFADSPEELEWLLEEAADLLDGQEMYFGPQIKLMPGTRIQYYFDDTILAITWKEARDYGAYTFSEVKIAHPSQFRRFLADGEFGSSKLYITTEMAANVNAVVASSGDFYRFRQAGVLVYDGIVRRVTNWMVDTCYIDNQGDMHFTGVWDSMKLEEAQAFVDENDINFSVAFGPVLIRDGAVCTPNTYKIGEINDEYSRAALCQMGKLHYLLATVNAERQYVYVPTIHRFAANLKQTGCLQAYALDGGQTAVIAMDDELVNAVMYGYQRKISDIIYFATAIPNGG